MATPYQKKKARVGKYTPNNLMFTDFSEGLYLLDTPRDINEQVGSLALIGGRNICSEKGSLIPQYGYSIVGKLPDDEIVIGVSRDSLSATIFYLITLSGHVYVYSVSQGLKKFKTTLDTEYLGSKPLLARRNNDLIAYYGNQCIFFGNFYKDGISNIITDNEVQPLDYEKYYEVRLPIESQEYYWIDKKISVYDIIKEKIYGFNVTYVGEEIVSKQGELVTELVVRFIWENTEEERPLFEGKVNLGEQTLLPIDLVYKPEGESLPSIPIRPKLMEVCNNRLCIVDMTGNIFYSQLGVLTETDGVTNGGFNEAYGAGYFGGFYNDSSEVLSIEEYKTGILITKKNGMYYLTISDNVSSSSVSAESVIGINIKKISDIGQQYATDHIIVMDRVYAYDSNSASIVEACVQNVFGGIVPGKTLISAEFLNANNYGITEAKRNLVFNKDAQVFVLYYGEDYKHGIVLNAAGNLFPRELNKSMYTFLPFNQSVYGITEDNYIFQDYKKNTLIPDVEPVAEFEPIALKDSRVICSSIIEITELNGIEYDLTTRNAITSYQHIKPYTNIGVDKIEIPPMMYSDEEHIYPSYGLTKEEEEAIARGETTEAEIIARKGLRRWAKKKSNLTRVYAPMSGREGLSISLQFPKNVSFCVAGFRFSDFSQGE